MPSHVRLRRPHALVVLLVAVLALLGSGLVADRASAAFPPCLKCDWPPEVGPPLPEPDTQIITAPPALTADPQPYFSFSVVGAPGMIQFFTCSWVPDTVSLWEPSTQFDCPSEKSTVGTTVPFPYGGDYPDRQYRLRVMGCQMTFISVANCDRSPALVTFRVDRTGPTLAFDAGTAADGAHLPAAKQTVAWHALENGITDYTCVLDARAPFSNCGTASLFTWSGDGTHTVSITAKDALGNVGPALTRSWVVDTKVPVTTWTTRPPALGKDRRPAIAYKGTDADQALAASCTLEGPLGTTTPPCTATAWTPPADLADGSYAFSVRHTDRAGNASAAVRTTFAIDATPPELGAVGWDERTGRFTFTAGPGGTVSCSLDGGPFAPCASPFDGSALAPGPHVLLVQSVDALGNGTEQRRSIVVPEPPKPEPTPSPSPSPSPSPKPSPSPVPVPSSRPVPTPAAEAPGAGVVPAPAAAAPSAPVATNAPAPTAVAAPGSVAGPGAGAAPFAADAGLTERSSPEVVAQAFGLPSAKACLSRRAFAIRLKVPAGIAVKSASIAVNGKTGKARLTKGRWQATVDLRGLRKGRVTVRIKVVTTAGTTLTGTRSYGVCGAKRGS